MSSPITYADLAETYEALALPGAAHMRASAEGETVELAVDGAFTELWAVLDAIAEPTGRKHDDDCWKTHARCLAVKIREVV